MDWRKTKTIFIITFLVLNIYLGYQIYEKRKSSRVDPMAEPQIEEHFEADEITYIELPKDSIRKSYISGKSYKFTPEDAEELENRGQSAEFLEETTLIGVLEEPISIPETNIASRLAQLLKDHVLYSENYQFWDFNEEENKIIFLQKYKNELIYSNYSELNLILDEEKKIVSYQQTLITDLEEMDEAQEIIPAIQALENMYNMNELLPGSNVTKVELGFYSLVQYTTSHVLTPTWHIVVNEEEDFFVNAFEGQIIRKENRILE